MGDNTAIEWADATWNPIGDAQIRVLLGLLAVYGEHGRATVRTVARAVGRNVSTTHSHLSFLRAQGLVTWTDGESGTLRPLVQEIPR